MCISCYSHEISTIKSSVKQLLELKKTGYAANHERSILTNSKNIAIEISKLKRLHDDIAELSNL